MPLDRIVATALRIVDEEGADALSMRTLAQRLDSGTATLYRHFANRAALIAQVVDRVFGEIEVTAEALTEVSWQQACLTTAHTMFETLRRHKNVAPLLVERVPMGPNAMTYRERWIAALLDNRFPPQLAAYSYAALARYVLGFAIQLSDRSTAGSPDDTQLVAAFHGLDPALFPATVAVADTLPVALEDEFAFGLELIVNGLTQLRERETSRSKT
ncbi:TetR family transcriptional regulator [Mycobacterium sp. 852002-51057_SCH5723018]|nr:TetR family transcriptional regulator [Mycobacterium sp. 852002-51057_SCH5723018]